MRNIYTPEDIDFVLETILGRSEDLAATSGRKHKALLERRAVFIASVGRACADEVLAVRADSDTDVVVFAGDDINGAYAIETAIALHKSGCQARLVLINIGGNLLKPDTKAARTRFLDVAGSDYLYETVDINLKMPQISNDMIVVDGLFGREYKKPLRGGYQALARRINDLDATVISIDLPSGMSPELSVGLVNQNIVHADITLTLVGPSLAFFMPENAELLGRWKTLKLAYPKDVLRSIKCSARLIDNSVVKSLLPHRDAFSSKADLGTVLLYAGSYGMMGAAVLSARGALRSGCGKVIVHAPRCGFYVLQTAVPSAMFETDGSDMELRDFDSDIEADGIAVGPGIGHSDPTIKGLEQLFNTSDSAKTPLVIDADALNCIAMHPALLDHIPERSVLTPHAGEFDRIFGPQPSSSARLLKALEMAAKYRVIIVLKGHYTQTVWPSGAVLVNSSGSEALATPGSGDVLTGILAGFIAQQLKPDVAAVAAVFVHGIAGHLAAEEFGICGVTAEDIAQNVGNAIELIQNASSNGKKK